jgi:hypothetical protein
MEKNDSFQPTGKRLDNLNRKLKFDHPEDLWVMNGILDAFLSIIDSSSTIEQQRIVSKELNRLFDAYEFRYNTILENQTMDNEFKRMQELAGVKTPKEKTPSKTKKENINENFVGMGMVGNIFDREKTDYENAFEHFMNDKYTINEEEGAEQDVVDAIVMDVPLFIRMLEYAREDASTDMDLHDVAEKAINLTKEEKVLTMKYYEDLVGENAETEEEI